MFLMFFICKLMFLTSMAYISNRTVRGLGWIKSLCVRYSEHESAQRVLLVLDVYRM